MENVRCGYVSLETLIKCVEQEKVKKIQDATKKRAAIERVDYATFKNRVAVCHLCPVNAVAREERCRHLPVFSLAEEATIGKVKNWERDSTTTFTVTKRQADVGKKQD